MNIDYQYAVQDELNFDHDESLDHWARLLANQEVGYDAESYEWDYHYENFWRILDADYNFDAEIYTNHRRT